MRLKLIESAILLVVVIFVGGCEPTCTDFDRLLGKFFGDAHYVRCVSGFVVEDSSRVGPGSIQTYSPRSAFDCGPSVNGQDPLPTPRSAAAVPNSTSSAVSPTSQAIAKSGASALAQGQYLQFGFNNGYVPPGALDPKIPVPAPASASLDPGSCSNSADVLFVNHLHGTITRLGRCPFTEKAAIPLVSRPLQVAVSPDGTFALVTSFDNAINFVNLLNNTVSFTLRTAASINPAGVAITPDGARAYVTSFNNINSVILVIDIASHQILATIPTGAWPQAVFLTPDGSQAWVTYPFQNEVDIFDTLTNTLSSARLVNFPTGIAFDSAGTRAYIGSNGGSQGLLLAFDTATFRQVDSYAVGNYPNDVSVLPGERFVVVNNFISANLSVVDTVTGMVMTQTLGSGATSSMGLALVQ